MSLLERVRTFESLYLRDYRFLWLGQLTTSMGLWMDQVARTWLIYKLTHSALSWGWWEQFGAYLSSPSGL